VKKYIVHLSDKQRELMTKELVTQHAAYLKSLKELGVLPFCGPCTDGTALMIIDAPSQEKAKEYVDNDPFSKINYYMKRKIVEVEEATIENGFLVDEVINYLEKDI